MTRRAPLGKMNVSPNTFFAESQIVNDTLLDYACEQAAAKAARGNQIARFEYLPGVLPRFHWHDDIPVGSLEQIANYGWCQWVAYPTGLVQPLARVNWFWLFRDGPRLGTAEQAWRFAQRNRFDPAVVFAAPADRVHGTCVRPTEAHRMVQAISFPAWAGV